MPPPSPAPGWYRVEEGERWWDGTQWSDHVRAVGTDREQRRTSPSGPLVTAEYIAFAIVVGAACGVAVALVSYGILGDWGAVTTDKLDPHSLRYSALVTAGAGSLVSIVWILVVGVVYAVLTICLRRQIRGASGPGG